MWYTYDTKAEHIVSNAYGEALLRLPPQRNASLSAPATERPDYRVFRDGIELPADALPLQRAVRGENVRDEELDIRLGDGSSVALVFQASPIRGASGEIQGAVCAAIDITDRKRHEQHRELLLNELNHRVKNTLATVQSFAMQTLRNAATLPEGRDAFEARLVALSKAHDVLTREHWEGAGMREIVRGALAAYAGAQDGRLHFEGPEIRVSPRAALTLSMALHELATNAVKYGALSNDKGRVSIDWHADRADGRFRLRWVESGGPPVTVPRRRGFGSRLIEQGVSQDLAGEARLHFDAQGVACTIEASLGDVRSRPRP
jgi:two-component sensor histidine kinase